MANAHIIAAQQSAPVVASIVQSWLVQNPSVQLIVAQTVVDTASTAVMVSVEHLVTVQTDHAGRGTNVEVD